MNLEVDSKDELMHI